MIGALLDRLVGWLDRLLALCAGSALFGLMCLTFADVMGRKFWRAVPGALELSEMLMVVVLFCALPLVSRRGEHVSFELADLIYRGRWSCWSLMFRELVCAIAMLALGYACWGYAIQTLADAEISVYWRIPLGWFVYLMSIMLLLAGLLHALRIRTLQQQ